jgi:periplasmic divalent cation tolerance protein
MSDSEIIIVLTHVPDNACANKIAHALVQSHLAACVNISSPTQSIYRWQGNIEESNEIAMQIKTHRAHYPQVEQTIRALHPYELPEIIYLHISGGEPHYLSWVYAQLISSDANDLA